MGAAVPGTRGALRRARHEVSRRGDTLGRPGSEGFNTVDRGPKRDLLGPLAEAVRAEGMRFGVYYSGGLDWSITDNPPIVEADDIWRFRPNDPAYTAYATAHVRDLIDRYAPSVLWNDIEWPEAGKEDGSLVDLIAYYRDAVPDGIVNDRWGADVWDYRDAEVTVTAEADNWYRTWASGDKLVVIADRPEAVRGALRPGWGPVPHPRSSRKDTMKRSLRS